MGFNLGAFAKGFAERDMELRDEAREAARTKAAATAKYRLEAAMTKKKELDAEVGSARALAKKLRSYGYNENQLLTLAEQGRLEDVFNYHEKATQKGIKITPDSVVTQAIQMPDGSTFDDAFKNAVIGMPTKFEEKDLYGTQKPTGDRSFFDRVLNPDFSELGRKEEEGYYKSAGFDTQEVAQLSTGAYTKDVMGGGVVDMSPFEGVDARDTTPKDWRTTVQSAIKSSGRNAISAMLQLDTEVNPYDGSLIYNSDKREMTETAYLVEDAMTQELHRRLRANPEADYSVEMNKITADYRRAVGDKRGAAAVTASFAWANSITGGNITAPTITEEPVPEPEPKSTIDWTNPNIDTDLRTVMTEDQWDKYSRLQKSSPEQARKYAEGLGLAMPTATEGGGNTPSYTLDTDLEGLPDTMEPAEFAKFVDTIVTQMIDAGISPPLADMLRETITYPTPKAVMTKAREIIDKLRIEEKEVKEKPFDGTVQLGALRYKLEGDPAVIEATKGWITSNEAAYRKAAEQAGLKLVPIQ